MVGTAKDKFVSDAIKLKKAWLFCMCWLGQELTSADEYIPNYRDWKTSRLRDYVRDLKADYVSSVRQVAKLRRKADCLAKTKWFSDQYDCWAEDGFGSRKICTAQEFERDVGLVTNEQTGTTDGKLRDSDGFLDYPSGTIIVDPNPDSLNATWTLVGPGGYQYSGTGDATSTNLVPGRYVITWSDESGWAAPGKDTCLLEENETMVLTGLYSGFLAVPAGTFVMGSPEGELGRDSDETQHQVTLTHSFYMQNTEVTNQQYMELAQWAVDNGYANATPSSLRDALDGSIVELLDLDDEDCDIDYKGSAFTCENPDHPVQEVTWYQSVAYCDWLSLREGLARAYNHSNWRCNGNSPYTVEGYRLPTEAEWEYACRAGSTMAFTNGEITQLYCNLDPILAVIGWYCGNTNGRTEPVGQKISNAWGLYDMHGNVSEWCNDWYGIYSGDVTDPEGPESGIYRVLRGGSWYYYTSDCRSANRDNYVPDTSSDTIGFRPVRSAD